MAKKKGRKLGAAPDCSVFRLQACIMTAQKELCHHREGKETPEGAFGEEACVCAYMSLS